MTAYLIQVCPTWKDMGCFGAIMLVIGILAGAEGMFQLVKHHERKERERKFLRDDRVPR